MKKRNFLHFKEDKGSATIEALISFTGFLFVIFTILSVVNVCRAQMLISNAVDTATKEITQYSYFYEMSGLSKFKADVDGNAEIGAANLNDIISTVDSFATSVGTAYDNSQENVTNITNAANEGNLDYDAIQKTILSVDSDVDNITGSIDSMSAAFGSVADNPLLYMKSIVAVAGSEFLDRTISHVIAAPLAKAFVTKHFGENAKEADAELERLGVVDGLDGMNFKLSTMFSAEEPDAVHIVVYYKVKIIQLLDWATLEVNICKESVGRAWLGGDDVKKTVTPMEPIVEPEEDDTSEDEQTETDENKEDTDADNKVEGSGNTDLWALPKYSEDGYYMVQTPAFYDLMGETYGFDPDKNSDFLLGHNGTTQYACTNMADTEWMVLGMGENQHSIIADNAYYSAAKSLKEAEALYDPSVGNSMGQLFTYKPGEVTHMTYVVYVPENIPDDVLNEMKAKSEIGADSSKAKAKEVLGRELEVTISFAKAGGNYDYGSEE